MPMHCLDVLRRGVKKFMPPLDDSISASRPIVFDYKLIDCGQSLVLNSRGIAGCCPCLDDCVPYESESGALAVHALTKLLQLRSALTKLPLSLILSTFLHRCSNSDSGLEERIKVERSVTQPPPHLG